MYYKLIPTLLALKKNSLINLNLRDIKNDCKENG